MWAQRWRNVAQFNLPYPDKEEVDLTAELRAQVSTQENLVVCFNPSGSRTTQWTKFSERLKTSSSQSIWQRCPRHSGSVQFWKNLKTGRWSVTPPLGTSTTARISESNSALQSQWNTLQQLTTRWVTWSTSSSTRTNQSNSDVAPTAVPILSSRESPLQILFSGFHEAVGDLISLSVESRKHLRKIGLLKSESDDPENVLNNLFQVCFRFLWNYQVSQFFRLDLTKSCSCRSGTWWTCGGGTCSRGKSHQMSTTASGGSWGRSTKELNHLSTEPIKTLTLRLNITSSLAYHTLGICLVLN